MSRCFSRTLRWILPPPFDRADIAPTGARGKITQLVYGLLRGGARARAGFDALPPGARGGLLIGAVGVVLAVIEDRAKAPEKIHSVFDAGGHRVRHPGLEHHFDVHRWLSRLGVREVARAKAERYSIAIGAGFIAGESLVAVLVAALMAPNLLQAG